MNKALVLTLAILLSPAISQAAPVKRFKFNGKATEVTVNLNGEKTTTKWSTPVSIAQSGSTVTINFRQFNGSRAKWQLQKSGNEWTYYTAPFSVPVTNPDFFYCEMSGSLGARFKNGKGVLASVYQLDCYTYEYVKVSAINAVGVKLSK